MKNNNENPTEFQDDFQSMSKNALSNVGNNVSISSMPTVPSPDEPTPVIPPFSGYVKIEMNRFGYGKTATCSSFTINAYDKEGNLVDTFTGYFLEPVYDPTRNTQEGSNTAISSGTYEVAPAYHNQQSGYYELLDVPGRSAIHIHQGNTYIDTTGCLLVGSNYSFDGDTYRVGMSTVAMNKFRYYLDYYGSGHATLTVND